MPPCTDRNLVGSVPLGPSAREQPAYSPSGPEGDEMRAGFWFAWGEGGGSETGVGHGGARGGVMWGAGVRMRGPRWSARGRGRLWRTGGVGLPWGRRRQLRGARRMQGTAMGHTEVLETRCGARLGRSRWL